MFYLFLRQRETEHEWGWGREGDTESEAGSRPWAVRREPDVGLELTNCEIMTWAKVRHLTDWATQVPHLFLSLKVYLFLRERERQSTRGEGQKEKDTQNPKQAPGSELSAQSPTRGLNSQTVRSWPEPKSDT